MKNTKDLNEILPICKECSEYAKLLLEQNVNVWMVMSDGTMRLVDSFINNKTFVCPKCYKKLSTGN